MIEGFLEYRGWRWLWASVGLVALALVGYCSQCVVGGPHGASLYGVTVGIIAFLLIVFLLWFAVRKRQYSAHQTTLVGWLSAHVWLGLTLILLVPLHSGFQFNWNVHTLAYVLMLATILSGVWGAVLYRTMPYRIVAHRGGGSAVQLLEEIQAIERSLQGLTASQSDAFVTFVDELRAFTPRSPGEALLRSPPELLHQENLTSEIRGLPERERPQALSALTALSRHRELVIRLWRDTRALALLKVWLYLHLVFAASMFVALLLHVAGVLFFL